MTCMKLLVENINHYDGEMMAAVIFLILGLLQKHKQLKEENQRITIETSYFQLNYFPEWIVKNISLLLFFYNCCTNVETLMPYG